MITRTRLPVFRIRARVTVAQAYNKVVAELKRKSAQFAHAPIGMHTLSPQGIILEANQKWLDVMGYDSSEVVGHSIFEFIKPEQRGNAQARFEARLADRELPPKQGDRIYITKSGREVEIITHDTVYHAHGRVTEVQTSFIDVTEVNILRRAAIAGEKQALIGRVAQAILHRLNNKNQAVSGYAALIATQVRELFDLAQLIGDGRVPTPEEWETISKGIIKCQLDAENLERATKATLREADFSLGFARNEKDAWCSILEETKYTIDVLAGRAEAEGIIFEFENIGFDPNDCISMPISNFRDILEVVIANAFESFPAGLSGEKRVKVLVKKEGQRAILSVSDNGAGIDPSVADRLFSAEVVTTKATGNGIGCCIVGGHVKQAGGEIRIESQKGSGTTVSFLLPFENRQLAHVRPTEVAPVSQVLQPNQILVWVVDDEAAVRFLLDGALDTWGFQRMIFTSAEMVLAAWATANTKPNIIVSDLQMPPGMDGFAMIRILQQDNPGLATRFVITTGFQNDEIATIARELSTVVLPKPYRMALLQKTISDLANLV